MPKLRYLHVTSSRTVLSEEHNIFVETLNYLHQPHNIETLRIGCLNEISNFDGWDIKFPKLTSLSVYLGVPDENKLSSLINNLPNLETLKIGGYCINNQFQNIHKLTKLKKLNLIGYFLQDNDLENIIHITSLKNLILMEECQAKELSLTIIGYHPYTKDAISSFESKRLDVFISFRLNSINKPFEEPIIQTL